MVIKQPEEAMDFIICDGILHDNSFLLHTDANCNTIQSDLVHIENYTNNTIQFPGEDIVLTVNAFGLHGKVIVDSGHLVTSSQWPQLFSGK